MFSASPLKADIARRSRHVGFVPMSDIAVHSNTSSPRRHCAQENRCAFDRRSVVAITLRGSL
jgi:hypothetical protein